jgi:hypothetical protein
MGSSCLSISFSVRMFRVRYYLMDFFIKLGMATTAFTLKVFERLNSCLDHPSITSNFVHETDFKHSQLYQQRVIIQSSIINYLNNQRTNLRSY